MLSVDFFRLKPKQPRTANKGDSGLITEVTGEFSARSCDPPHPYMKNAPMAQKFCDQRCKTTFATVSAKSRHRTRRWNLFLEGVVWLWEAAMPLTGPIPEGRSFFCPRCGALYAVTYPRPSGNDNDGA